MNIQKELENLLKSLEKSKPITNRPIIDEFTSLKCSQQRKYQLRKIKQGKCAICGRKAVTKCYCEKHRKMISKLNREYRLENQKRTGSGK